MNYDLIVVGAGILGASHAYHAAKMGLKVLLLEKDSLPVGSSVRNFGQVVPSGMSGAWFRYGLRSLEIYQELQQKADLSIVKQGSIYLASDTDELQLINELYQKHQKTGYTCTLLGKRQTLDLLPDVKSDYPVGALYFPDELSLDPHRFLNGFLQYLQSDLGVTVRTNTAVIKIDTPGNVYTATKEMFQASKILVCCGYTFNLLYPEIFFNSELVVSKLQMMQTAPMTKMDLQGNILTGLTIRRYESFAALPSFKNLQTPEHYLELQKWGIHILFKQNTDGSIIVGDSHEYAPGNAIEQLGYHTQEMIDDLILAEAQRIVRFPLRKITHKWAGFYGQHPDDIFVQAVSEKVTICTGIGGKGMTSSLGFAEKHIESVLNNQNYAAASQVEATL